MEQFDKFIQDFNNLDSSELLTHLLQFLLWTIFILFVAWLIRKGINRNIEDNASRYRARKVTRLFSYVLIALVAIVSFTGKVQYFSITIGIFSAGLAFALQEVILSTAGWISIFASKIYKPGDRVEINGIKGDVIDIGITKTTLMEIGDWVTSDNYNGRIVQISNSFVFKVGVYNYSTDFPFVWDEITLPIKYGSDLELATKIIQQRAENQLAGYAKFAEEHWKKMVKKYMIENAHVSPTISLKLTDNWVEFKLRYVVDYKKRTITKTTLFTEMQKAIEATNGKVNLASATFELVGIPEVDVQFKDKSSN